MKRLKSLLWRNDVLKKELFLFFHVYKLWKQLLKTSSIFSILSNIGQFGKVALKLNQAVFVWYWTSFSAQIKKRETTRPLVLFHDLKLYIQKRSWKKTNRKFTQTQESCRMRSCSTSISTQNRQRRCESDSQHMVSKLDILKLLKHLTYRFLFVGLYGWAIPNQSKHSNQIFAKVSNIQPNV